MTRSDRLRTALYRSGAERQTIRAMILELECGFRQQDPERAVADPEPKPREAADGETAVDRAGSSSETSTRQTSGCGSAVPQCPVEASTGKPVSHGEGDGSSPLTHEAVR